MTLLKDVGLLLGGQELDVGRDDLDAAPLLALLRLPLALCQAAADQDQRALALRLSDGLGKALPHHHVEALGSAASVDDERAC